MSKNKKHMANFGFSTILLSFSMICIITFAALSLLTANSDYQLSKKVAEKNKNYYQIQNENMMELSKIDTQLHEIYNQSNHRDVYFQQATNMLNARQSGSVEVLEHDIFYHFSNELNKNQTLMVTIKILYPNNKTEPYYQITQWQTLTDTNVETDDTLNLIGNN